MVSYDGLASASVGDLLAAARAGDPEAWDRIVDRFGGRVRAVARAFRLGHADADDVYQVTFLRLVSNLDSIREPERIGAWLVTTASRECLRVLRRSSRYSPAGDGWEESLPDAGEELDANLITDERDRALWQAMGMLSAPCQRLLRLLAADPEPSYREVSLALGMPTGSIGPTRRRCLDQLRDRLARITGSAGGSLQ